jgi:ribosomal protein L11 methyltransferase
MFVLTAIGPRGAIEAAAALLEDVGGFGAVGWFEQERRRYKLEAYADDEAVAQTGIGVLAIEQPDMDAKFAPLDAQDWVKMSLLGLPPVPVRRFRVVGTHDIATIRTGTKEIIVDAGEAFGTGHHGTTAGCLRALDNLMRKGLRPKHVLDVGSGSNVLAIGAAKLGARALAVEIDARAAEIGHENSVLNKVRTRVTTKVRNGVRDAGVRAQAPFDLIFANILRKPLIKLAPDLSKLVAPGGHIVVSGLLSFQEPSIRRAYRGQGMILVDRYRQETWSTLTWKRPE